MTRAEDPLAARLARIDALVTDARHTMARTEPLDRLAAKDLRLRLDALLAEARGPFDKPPFCPGTPQGLS